MKKIWRIWFFLLKRKLKFYLKISSRYRRQLSTTIFSRDLKLSFHFLLLTSISPPLSWSVKVTLYINFISELVWSRVRLTKVGCVNATRLKLSHPILSSSECLVCFSNVRSEPDFVRSIILVQRFRRLFRRGNLPSLTDSFGFDSAFGSCNIASRISDCFR